MTETRRRPIVVIAGFGDSGVLTAVNLPRAYEVVAITTKAGLISGQELGARVTDLERWKRDYLTAFDRFKKLDGVSIVQGRVASVDPFARTLDVAGADGSARRQPYDALVIATGISNGFWRDDRFADLAQAETTIAAQQATLAGARTVAVVGGGPSGVSVAANLRMRHPDKAVHFFFTQSLPLPNYHPRTRAAVTERLAALGVTLHPEHRALLPAPERLGAIGAGRIEWANGEPPFEADAIVWTTGALRPNTSFLPPDMLDADGFVAVDEYLRVRGQERVFAVGDAAASDANRSSARNWGAPLLARNIKALLSGRPQAMKPFVAPAYRWGSILGLEPDGLRVFQPNGGVSRFSPWSVRTLLFPLAVRRMIYRGVRPLTETAR